MITELGKLLRKLRIDRGEVLKDMADRIGLSSAYLSAIELGNRAIPNNFIGSIIQAYTLDSEMIQQLHVALDQTIKNIRIDLDGTSQAKRNAALVFARNFEAMDKATANSILKLFDTGGTDIV